MSADFSAHLGKIIDFGFAGSAVRYEGRVLQVRKNWVLFEFPCAQGRLEGWRNVRGYVIYERV